MDTYRAERIEEIIRRRRPLAARVMAAEKALEELAFAIRELDALREVLIADEHGFVAKAEHGQVLQRLRGLHLTPLLTDIAERAAELARLRARLARETLNIGVLGMPGQGKSRLLQSMCGLGDDVIPSGDRSHCTGVRSTIVHRDHDRTEAIVECYSPRAFLDEVLAEYYTALGLGAPPLTLEQFRDSPLPPLPSGSELAARGTATVLSESHREAAYNTLKVYHQQTGQYADLLHRGVPFQIDRAAIRSYVAQDTPDGQRVFFNYLAVREAQIFCRFREADLGRIAVVDMPGLGDARLGNEGRLIAALGNDIDFVLLVRKPDALRGAWLPADRTLYELARAALTDIPVEERAFVVLNHTRVGGDNIHNCEELRDTIVDQGIRVADCVIADCSDEHEVWTRVLDPVLSYLTANITRLDARYARACDERLRALHDRVNAEMEKAVLTLGESSGGDDPTFDRLFREVWQRLTFGLSELLIALDNGRSDGDLLFQARFREIMLDLWQPRHLPTTDEIRVMRHLQAGYDAATLAYLHKLRTDMSREFLDLDISLRASMDDLKRQVAGVLREDALLGALSPTDGPEFLRYLTKHVPDRLEALKFGLTVLSDFELQYRGFIQHRIRQHLDRLIPDKTNVIRLPSPPTEDGVRYVLETMRGETLSAIEESFEQGNWFREPRQVAFSIVEEFVDRVLRAEGAEIDWRQFYYLMRARIWPEEFDALATQSQMRVAWDERVDRCLRACRPDRLRLGSETPAPEEVVW